MKLYTMVILLTAIVLQFSCTMAPLEVSKDIIAKKVLEFDEYTKDQYVVNVSDIMVEGDQVLFLDEGLSKVVVMTNDFQNAQLIGERGQGPGELYTPTHLIREEDKIYIYDVRNLKISMLDLSKKSISNDIKIPFPIMPANKGFIDQSILYFTTPIERKVQIQKFDLSKGSALEGIQLSENTVQSSLGRNLFKAEKGFVSVKAFDEPVIETFDKEWNLTNSLSLGEVPLIKRFLNFESTSGGLKISGGNGRSPKPVASGKMSVKYTLFKENTLYLLVSSIGEDEKSRSNVILKYKQKDNSWSQSGRILLPAAGSYSSFALQPNKGQLIAFQRLTSTVEIFDIDE